ncbi:MAG: hypothetical protein IGQ45_06005 [Cyanobacterium sp. T60_A2020_053]|nr:hypothetical protein [Cyanobacterium sp. T60_A2020_053]
MNTKYIGLLTAKEGFLNEKEICKKFESWKIDNEAKKWLEIMGYIPEKISSIDALHIPVKISKENANLLGISTDKYEESIKYKKADIQVQVKIIIKNVLHIENISLKKANISAGFNQVDKRPVKTYKKMWNFDNEVEKWLKAFTGEILPKDILSSEELKSIKDQRRLFFHEMPENVIKRIIDFFFKK